MALIKGFSFGQPKNGNEIKEVAEINQCILKDFSKHLHCKEQTSKKNHVKCNTRNKSLKESVLLLKRNEEKCTERAIKHLSIGLSFGGSVVGERSPHNEKFNKNNNIKKKLETSIDKSKVKNRKPHTTSYYNNRHMSCHLQPAEYLESGLQQQKKQPIIRNVESNKSFCLGINNSMERLTRIPALEYQNNKVFQEESKIFLKPIASTSSWEEHVLSLVSNSTANTIVKDYTTINQTTLKKFMDGKNEKLSLKTTEDSTLASEIEITKVGTVVEHEEQSTEEKASERPLCFIELTPNSKKVPKEFETMLQKSYPLPPENWSTKTETKSKMMSKKGIQKWTGYPVEIKEEGLKLKKLSTEHFLSKNPQEIDLRIASQHRNNHTLLAAVDEWRGKWLLEKKWQMKTMFELKEGMKSINDHVRLAAVSAVGKVIVGMRGDKTIDEDVCKKEERLMVEEINELLNDRSPFVALAAAISLYSINHTNQQATNLLLDTVQTGAPSEKWIACQCLAEHNHHEDCIVIEMLNMIQNGVNPVKQKRIEHFLRELSKLTDSIQYMLSEKLNSTSLNDRTVACQLFPILSGPLKKDVANKLSYLTWHDWNKDIRMLAAVALGRTGNGKLIHDALCKYLKSPKISQQIESLRKISSLGIVTSQLMVPFLLCLKSQHGTVCLEALRVVRVVHLCTDDVIDVLVALLDSDSDRNLKIKLNAIKTLGTVGRKDNTKIREALLWCMRFFKERVLREAACEAVGSIKFSDKEVISTMQDMLVVEENQSFRSLLSNTLRSMGFEDTCDKSMVTAVKERVKKLCAKENVLLRVLDESSEDLLNTYRALVGQQNDEMDDEKDEEKTSNQIQKMSNPFDPTLEGYRARQIRPPDIVLPDMEPSFIPYWSASHPSLRCDDDDGGEINKIS